MSNRDDDSAFAEKVATELGFEFLALTYVERLELIIRDERKTAVVFIDADDERNKTVMTTLAKYLHSSRIFSFADKEIFTLSPYSYEFTIGHYCIRKYDAFAFESISKIVKSLLTEDATALQNYLDPGVKQVRVTLKNSKEKPVALKGLEKLLGDKGIHERCIDFIVQAVDELLMNAIFDAPQDEKGRTYRKPLGRNDELFLFDKEEVELGIVLNRQSIMIIIEDHFGSFSPAAALKLIKKDYTNQKYQADSQIQSAGLGLHRIVRSGMGLTLNVKPKVLTQAILWFPLFKNVKSMKNSFHSFSLHIMNEKAFV